MVFERTLASSEGNEETEETLKEGEETPTATGEAEENEGGSEEDTSTNDSESGDDEEESVEALKERLTKAEQDRDNYKAGMLSAKGKKRAEAGVVSETKGEVDVNEEAVNKVLSKREEQKALSNTISSTHPDYIPELVDDNQYNQIIGYLPRNVDKTSYDSIVRGLKLATKMWKEDKGIKDKSPKKDTGLQNTKSSTSTGSAQKEGKKKGERKILKSNDGVESWF